MLGVPRVDLRPEPAPREEVAAGAPSDRLHAASEDLFKWGEARASARSEVHDEDAVPKGGGDPSTMRVDLDVARAISRIVRRTWPSDASRTWIASVSGPLRPTATIEPSSPTERSPARHPRPVRRQIWAPVVGFHAATLPSDPSVTRRSPSGLKPTSMTHSLPDCRTVATTRSPVVSSRISTKPPPAGVSVATNTPRGLHATRPPKPGTFNRGIGALSASWRACSASGITLPSARRLVSIASIASSVASSGSPSTRLSRLRRARGRWRSQRQCQRVGAVRSRRR